MKRYNMNITCKGLYNRMEKGEINFDCAVQRSLVWDNERKSLLIHSILYGYSIPAFYMVKNDEDGFDSLDGKQRSNAIHDFIGGEYGLSESFPVVYDDEGEEENFSGMYWENLPEWAQDRIKDYSLTVYYYEDMKEEEIREFFRRLNNGKPLSAIELTRVQCKCIDIIQELATHEAVEKAVTDKGKARFADENLIMQIYGMAYMEDLDFSTKVFRPYIQDAIISGEQKERILKGLNYVAACMKDLENNDTKETNKVLRKLKSKTHFVSMAYYGMLCADREVLTSDYIEKVFKFFNTGNNKASISPLYNETVGAGSARQQSVERRKNVIRNL